LAFADVQDIFEMGLHEYIDAFQQKLNQVSTSIFDTFFSIENVVKQNQIIQQ
jgi:uncharacterized alpha-E superfamily protein